MPKEDTATQEPIEVTIPIAVRIYPPMSMFLRVGMASGNYEDGTEFDIGMIASGAGIVLSLHAGGASAAILCQHLVEPLRAAIEEAGYGSS